MTETAPTAETATRQGEPVDAAELARTVVFAIEDRKGEDIVMMDLREVSPISDYFVIATADNERQLRALVRTVDEQVREKFELDPTHMEGIPESGWVLMDYGWVMVHLFSRPLRTYYRLEELWDDAPVVLRIQ